MIYISNKSTNPYFNIAAEEYLLKNFSQQIFMLWRSIPSIIVGKHQNALAEINRDFTIKNNVAVVRRLSGGGAVYHDLGNLNFTFIDNKEKGDFINFEKYTKPIIEVLHSLGIDAYIGKCNDLRIDKLKFSGNAEHVHKNRVLHHGTLLFNSDLNKLNQALKVNLDRFKDKSVQSRRSTVTNITSHLKKNINIQQFNDLIFEHIIDKNKSCNKYKFNEKDITCINKLVEEKYKKWEWNFGALPKYSFKNIIKLNGKEYAFEIFVNKGITQDIIINTQNFPFPKLISLLIGVPHIEVIVIEVLKLIFDKNKAREIAKALF